MVILFTVLLFFVMGNKYNVLATVLYKHCYYYYYYLYATIHYRSVPKVVRIMPSRRRIEFKDSHSINTSQKLFEDKDTQK